MKLSNDVEKYEVTKIDQNYSFFLTVKALVTTHSRNMPSFGYHFLNFLVQ